MFIMPRYEVLRIATTIPPRIIDCCLLGMVVSDVVSANLICEFSLSQENTWPEFTMLTN